MTIILRLHYARAVPLTAKAISISELLTSKAPSFLLVKPHDIAEGLWGFCAPFRACGAYPLGLQPG
jgi:hypothetical protein